MFPAQFAYCQSIFRIESNPILAASTTDTVELRAADFDGDGDQDIFCASSNAALRKLYLNSGDGTLVDSGQSFGSTHARVADADGDGDLDILGNDTVYTNNGAGAFTSLGQSLGLDGFCAADLDGDGDVDLAGGGAGERVYINTGDGTFTHTGQTTFGACVRVQCGDMDGDGDKDAVVIACATSLAQIWTNNGKGEFGTAPWLEVSLSAVPMNLLLIDVDADGDLDIVPDTGNYKVNNGTFFGTAATGIFTGTAMSMAAGDFNNDGYPDIFAGGGLYSAVWLNNTTGGFNTITEWINTQTGKYPVGAVAADLDGDDYLDIVTSAEVTVFNDFVDGPPAPVAANTPPAAPAISAQADAATSTVTLAWAQATDAETPNALMTYNLRVGTVGAGHDVLSGAAPAGPGMAGALESLILRNLANGTYYWSVQAVDTGFATSAWSGEDVFTVNVPFALNEATDTVGTNDTSGVLLGDLDGNGTPDLAESTNSGVSVWLNAGGAFTSGGSFANPNANTLTGADVDNDGDLDMIIGYNGMNKIFLNNGSASFTDSSQSIGSGDTQAAAAFDADGDGDVDLVFGNASGNSTVWLNDGTGAYTEAPANLGSSAVSGLVPGDFDRDGDMDVILVINGNNLLYLNDGNGTYTDSGQSLGAGASLSGAAADVDGDGDPDFIEGFSGANRVWINNGSGVFSNSGAALGTGNTAAVSVADFDNDGDPDFFAANSGSGSKLWMNDGNGNFTDLGASYAAADTVNAAAAADLDSDGDVDVILGIEGPSKILLSNMANPGGGNSPDIPPSAPVVDAVGNPSLTTITLTWAAAADVESPLNQITYNLRVGKTSGSNDVFSGAIPVGPGNSGATASHVIRNVYPGAYFWSVQAVDGAFARSAWSSEDSFNNIAPFADAGQSLGTARTQSVFSADLNHDGDMDVVEGNNGATIIWVNDGSGSFTDSGQNVGTESTIAVIGADVDNNSFVDIVKIQSDGTARVFLNSSGVFADAGQNVDLSGLGAIYGGTAVDADGDGDLDLAVAAGGDNKLFLNNGAGYFTDSGTVMSGTVSYALTPLDVDRDGDADLIDGTASGVRIWINNGTGTYTLNPQTYGASTRCVAAADVNGDGVEDMIRGGSLGTNIFTGTGNGTFTDTGASIPTTTGIFSLHAVDADLDGDLDLLAGTGSGTLLFLNSGTGTFTDSKQVLGPNDTRAVTAADFDGDSDPDLFAGNFDQPNKLWENWRTGSGSPIAPNTAPGAPSPTGGAIVATPGAVRVSWSAGTDTETPAALLRYNVRFATASGAGTTYSGDIREGRTTAGATTSFTINLSATGTYYYAVQTVDSVQKKSPWSADGTILIDGDAPVFAGLSMAQDLGTGGAVRLSWSAATDYAPPITYNVYSSTATRTYNFTTPDFSTTATVVDIAGLVDGTAFSYTVRARDSLGHEETNNIALIVTPTSAPTTIPNPPTGLAASATLSVITLSWTAPALNTNGSALTDLAGFNVYRGASCLDPDSTRLNTTLVDAATTTYADYAVAENQTWYYYLTANNTQGAVSASSTCAIGVTADKGYTGNIRKRDMSGGTVSGTGYPYIGVPDVTVQLMNGTEEIASSVTDSNGNYILGLPQGTSPATYTIQAVITLESGFICDDGTFDGSTGVRTLFKNVSVASGFVAMNPANFGTGPVVGDLNCDWSVDITDFILLKNSYTREIGQENYFVDRDVNGDEVIDISDFILMKPNYGLSGNPVNPSPCTGQ